MRTRADQWRLASRLRLLCHTEQWRSKSLVNRVAKPCLLHLGVAMALVTKRRLLVGLVISFAVLLSYWVVGVRLKVDPGASRPTEPVASSDARDDAVSTVDAPFFPHTTNLPRHAVAKVSGAFPPLPDPALPLALQLPVLLERAKGGDPTSTCRIVIGVGRCSAFESRRAFIDRQMQNLGAIGQAGTEELAVETLARMEESLVPSQQFCDAFSGAVEVDTETLLAQAKPALSPRQKTVLAMMLSDGQVRRLQVRLNSTQAGEYLLPQFIADNTPEFLQAGFAAKEPLALEGLIMLHSPSSIIPVQGVMVRLPDQRRFLAFASLYRRLFGAEALSRPASLVLDTVIKSTDPAQLDRLSAEVEAEARRWAGRFGLSSLASGQTVPVPADPAEPLAACDD